MKAPADIILSELGDIQLVVRTACLVESAVRGEPADIHDPKVQLRAAELILGGLGEQIRAVATANSGSTRTGERDLIPEECTIRTAKS